MAAKPSKQVLGGREKVQVAIAQKSPAFMNREASVARACAAIEEAGRHGAHLVVFPEAWLAGYPYWTEGWDSPLPQWVGGRILFRDNGSRTSGLRINISASSRAVCVVSISRLSALEGVFSPLSPPVGLPLSAR